MHNNDLQSKQKIVATSLLNLLRRHNGRIFCNNFKNIFLTEKHQSLKLRLFSDKNNEFLEWKPEIVTEIDLARKMGVNANDIPIKIRSSFNSSKEIQSRSVYPHLAYANKKSQYADNSYYPVFGFDILIRAPTSFSTDGVYNNNFNIGKNAFAYFIHADADNFMLRANMGSYIISSGLYRYLDNEVTLIQSDIELYFYLNKMNELSKLMCEACNSAIKKWHFSAI